MGVEAILDVRRSRRIITFHPTGFTLEEQLKVVVPDGVLPDGTQKTKTTYQDPARIAEVFFPYARDSLRTSQAMPNWHSVMDDLSMYADSEPDHPWLSSDCLRIPFASLVEYDFRSPTRADESISRALAGARGVPGVRFVRTGTCSVGVLIPDYETRSTRVSYRPSRSLQAA